jgi:hypothetical protein
MCDCFGAALMPAAVVVHFVSIFFPNDHIPHQIAVAHAALDPCHQPPDYNGHDLIIILPLQAI